MEAEITSFQLLGDIKSSVYNSALKRNVIYGQMVGKTNIIYVYYVYTIFIEGQY